MLQRFAFVIAALVVLVGVCPTASAIAPVQVDKKDKGLYVSPVRKYVTLAAGESATHTLTVANLTDKPMTVTTHIERFSVADRSYDFTFASVNNDWVKFTQKTIPLQPNESHQIAYKIDVPKNTAPGGHYYTLYASSTTTDGASSSTIQATMLLYLTVDGSLVRTSQAIKESLPGLVVSPDITYSLDIKNTGNTHYFAYVSGTVDGLFYHDAPNGNSQLLMPGTVRTVAGTIKSPLVPGIYKLSYLIQPDKGDALKGSRYFLYLPLWFIILFGFALCVTGRALFVRARRKRSTTKQ